MKQTLLLIIGIIISFSLDAQNSETYMTSKLVPGCPKEIETVQNHLNLSDMSYALLQTGIDTLQIMFGEFYGGKGYWISLLNNDEILTWSTVKLIFDKEAGIFSKSIDIEYDNSSKLISVEILHDSSSNEIQYLWLDDNIMSNTMKIKKIDKPIQEGIPFPLLKVKTLNGNSLNIHDLIGKYVVINWWATTCGPCLNEMPGLNSLVDKYKDNSDIVFIAIANDKKDVLDNFLKIKDFKYMQTIGDIEASKLFGVSYPKHVIVNTEGIVTFYGEGGSEDRSVEIDLVLNKLIDE